MNLRVFYSNSKRSANLWLVILVVCLLGQGVFIYRSRGKLQLGRNIIDNIKMLAQTQKPSINSQIELPFDAFRLGKKEAPIVIIEFSDFECQFCRKFSIETFPLINAKYIETATVQYGFRHFPLGSHKNAMHLARLASCAAVQGKFWDFHDQIFRDVRGFSSVLDDGKLNFLDVASLNSCIAQGRVDREIMRDQEIGRNLGITGTPTFVIGKLSNDGKTLHVSNVFHGTAPFDAFHDAIEQLR